MQHTRHRKIHSPAFKAAIALATAVLLAACSPEAPKQGVNVAAASQTETAARDSLSREELARDIRTIVTGVKSPAQQAALAQAARIAPGQMNDDLREILVEAATFVNYLMLPAWEANDARLDSLSQLLASALQPQFSQEELTVDILSIAHRFHEESAPLEPVSQARQETAAWVAMHMRAGEMGEALRHAVIEGIASIGNESYGMYTTRSFLLDALINQTPGGMETLAANPKAVVGPGILDEGHMSSFTSFVRQISRQGTPEPYIPPPTPKPEITPFHGLLAAIQSISAGERGERQLEAVRHVEKMAEADPTQIGDTLRTAIVDAFLDMYNVAAKPTWGNPRADAYYSLLNPLERLIITVGDTQTVQLFTELDLYEYECVWTVSEGLFKNFPDHSIPLIIESTAQPGTLSEKTPNALYILAEIVIDYKRGRLEMSQDNRDLLIATTRRFLKEDLSLAWATRGMSNSYSDSNVLSAAIHLAIALDDPDLINILQELATNPDKITMLGLSDEQVEDFQEGIKWRLGWRPYMGPSDC